MKPNKVLTIIAVIFLIIGIVLVAVGIPLTIDTFSTDGKEETTAIITNIVSHWDGKNRYHDTYVLYEVDGQMYEERLGSYASSYSIGKEITVLYDKDDPSQVNAKGTRWAVMIMPALGLIFGGIGLCILLIPCRNRRKKEFLRENGTLIHAPYKRTELNRNYSVNGRHPFRIVCHWRDPEDGRELVFRSENLWQDPSNVIEERNITTITVYMDPNKKKRYIMDIDHILESMEEA